ncbi:MAG: DUF86 domain-containing protein [Deltaproteobacteria bacterium]|nr:MAG: DUF86 domain-containing protein [Deltaproteobacteria bacterium]TMQ20237.1 MAG: DUF86 domain-containing protein [Deltaproteobacteria bacterium]
MVQLEIVQRKLADLEGRVARVRAHRRPSAAELASDRDALDLVAFNLMLAVQAACDLAAHLIADEGWTAPPTAAESFQQLAEHQVITTKTAAALRRAVGFRNIVAHGYAGIDVGATYAASTLGLDDLDRFAREVATWLVNRATPDDDSH